MERNVLLISWKDKATKTLQYQWLKTENQIIWKVKVRFQQLKSKLHNQTYGNLQLVHRSQVEHRAGLLMISTAPIIYCKYHHGWTNHATVPVEHIRVILYLYPYTFGRKLTLFRSGRADYSHRIDLTPISFKMFRQACSMTFASIKDRSQ